MSKIALLASDINVVDAWRAQTGINADLAPWVTRVSEAEESWPFGSVLCLTGWEVMTRNMAVREYIVTRLAATGSTTSASEDTDEPADTVAVLTPRETFLPSVDGVRPRPNADWRPTPADSESLMRRFGINPGMIGMMNDETRNGLCALIQENETQARANVEALGRVYRISPWATPVHSDPVRTTLMTTIESYMGATYHDDFMNIDLPRLGILAGLARRARDARRLGDDDLEEQLRAELHMVLTAAREEYAAGFLPPPPDSRAEPASTPGPATERRFVPVTPPPRAFVDPLRDHLSAYMRSASRADAERRSDRASRAQDRSRRLAQDEERFRRLSDPDQD